MDREIETIYGKYIKRILDLFLGVIMLICLFIPMIIISSCILIREGRPVLFRQDRVGRYGKKFKIYKYRTMVCNAEQIGPKSTRDDDKRITPIGKFLRKTSLDELPQLLNVVKGDMSFIGYRPDVYEDKQYNELKYILKPGITGYAQVNGRSSLTLEEAESWEKKYTKDVSFITDLKIMFKTIAVVLRRDGSN